MTTTHRIFGLLLMLPLTTFVLLVAWEAVLIVLVIMMFFVGLFLLIEGDV
jgi:hypothetical protein